MATHTFTVTAPDIDKSQLAQVANDLRVDVTRRVLPGSEVKVEVDGFVSEDPVVVAERHEAARLAAVERQAAEDRADEVARQVTVTKRVTQPKASRSKPKAKA